MQAFHCDRFELPQARRSRFPIEKYRLLRERLNGSQHQSIKLTEAPPLDQANLAIAHSRDYIDRVINGRLSADEQRLLGFPWSPQLVERSCRSVSSTLGACDAALAERVAVNLAGGTHHARVDRGAGYCVFNDVAIAARRLVRARDVERVLIVDADVHQGDGTAQILNTDSSLYTFSIHGADNYPHHKALSDLDIALADGVEDSVYLREFRDGLTRAFLAARPQFVIYLAGADPYVDDRLGRLAVSKQGLRQRDEMLFDRCSLAQIPVAVVMAGGYASDVEDIVDIHEQTVRVAASYARRHEGARD